MIEGRDFAAASTIGARERQEDDWGTYAAPPVSEDGAGLLAVIADGMGGMPAGDRASRIAVRTFLDSFPAIELPARERLRHALSHANRELGIAVEGDSSLAGMGCTLVAALFFPNRCEWLSVGDSFLLLCRHGKVRRINPLHIYANELEERARRGEITADAAARNPDRLALTSAVQGTVLGDVAQGRLELESGDVVVLASDGLGTLSEAQISAVCAEHAGEGAVRVAETLIERIDAAGVEGQDNATVVVVREAAQLDEEDTFVVSASGAVKDAATGLPDVVAADAGTGDVDRETADVGSKRASRPTSSRREGKEVKAQGSGRSKRVAAVVVAFVLGLAAGAALHDVFRHYLE